MVVAIVVGASSSGATLDPDSFRPEGGRALRVLLEQRGVPVNAATHTRQAVRAAEIGRSTTVLVTEPDALPDSDLRRLAGLAAGVSLVLVGPGAQALARLTVPMVTGRANHRQRTRPVLPAAGRAGRRLGRGRRPKLPADCRPRHHLLPVRRRRVAAHGDTAYRWPSHRHR